MAKISSVYQSETACCGCSACAGICPRGAITMEETGGFQYPVLHRERCVGCGLCQKVCAFRERKNREPNCIAAYAGRARDVRVRMGSSSGGVFTVLSDAVLERGGVVYGAAYDGAMRVRHTRAAGKAERDAMRGSKYVQSDMTGVYRLVREDLLAGTEVLFSGTPCQVAALKSFLGREFDNLFLIDVICHGVPSPAVWAQFVSYVEAEYGDRPLADYSFRNKAVSWRRYSPKLTFRDGTVVGENRKTASFIELFRYDLCLRPSCTACRYASLHREGDITLGDFWGIEKVYPALDDGTGVSSLMLHSPKAERLLEQVGEKLEVYPCEPEQIAAGQPNLSRMAQASNKSEAFSGDLLTMGFRQVLRKYTRVGIKRRMIDIVKSLLRRS